MQQLGLSGDEQQVLLARREHHRADDPVAVSQRDALPIGASRIVAGHPLDDALSGAQGQTRRLGC